MDSLKRLLNENKIKGVLKINNPYSVEIIVNEEPQGLSMIQEYLSKERQQVKIEEAKISAVQL